MDEERISAVVKVLEQKDSEGVPFAKTHDLLTEQGYSETEIVQGIYRFPYDGKPNAKRPENEVTNYYEKHPELADSSAKALLNDLHAQERNKLVANSIGSSVGTTQSRAYYDVRVADQIGYPYYTVFFITLALAVASVKFAWAAKLFGPMCLLTAILSIYLCARFWYNTRKRK